ncbi:hypothetical protein [Helicobacter felis]|uniref:hypothetical protein n=1 Tax=Helicobacter felis TaxID=214 RepID=UPI001F1587B1|nr:hypothetical protein [Helicobacter felis]
MANFKQHIKSRLKWARDKLLSSVHNRLDRLEHTLQNMSDPQFGKISHPQKFLVFKRIENLSNENFIVANKKIAAGGGGNPLATNQLTTVISNMMKKAKTLQALSIHGLLFECVMRFAPWKNVCTQYSRRFNGE